MTIEPFRIKVVEPIRMSTAAEREEALRAAGFNLFKVPASAIIIDLLTDSGTGAMSSNQWAAMMQGDESYAGGASWVRFETAVKDIFGFQHVIPTHQGRAAERILASTLCRPGQVVPNNTHFDTTRANIEATGAEAVDVPCPEAADLATPHPFKGNIDLEALRAVLDGGAEIPFAMMTVTNNGGGGQPAAMENIAAASRLCRSRGVPFYLDACRYAENSYFIQQRTPRYAATPLIDIAREMFSYADGCTMSAKKDGMANIGGFLCTNDDQLANREREVLILTEGFPTYGGLAGRDLEAVAVGLYEALDQDYQTYRAASTRYLGRHLAQGGVPIVEPPGGHAIYIDARRLLPHIPPSEYPGQALAIEIYRTGGIRSVEVGSVMFGRIDKATGRESPAANELVRLAVPRRVYTQSQIDYTVRMVLEVAARRETLRGVRIVEQPPVLRHFSAVFQPLADRSAAAAAAATT
ncbi:MAG: tryptophanase [Acidobacteriota bacterium]|nr:tryptophanase [Acidobacteriota bacterium]